MQTAIDCIPCFLSQAAEVLALSAESPDRREQILRQILQALANSDWCHSPPALAQKLHRILRDETGNADPYRAVKNRMNRTALDGMPRWKELIARAEDSLEARVRLAVVGNLLDSAAKTGVRPEDLPRLFSSLWVRPLVGDPHEIFRIAEQATHILYLADNAGEIVFDRLLIEALPVGRVTLAVRGAPVLNDALLEDAAVAGITVPVITNGSDAPGTLLEDCSEVFRDHFRRADLILSKGQGNYESLSATPAPVIFLFTVKCPLVATHIGEPVGSPVIRRTDAWPEHWKEARRTKSHESNNQHHHPS